jgi:YidC/Oxa1 family membrane protein insertase
MDQARVLIAIVLSFLVFFLWNMLFPGKKPEDVSRKEVPAERAEVQKAEPIEDHDQTKKKTPEKTETLYIAKDTLALKAEDAKTLTVTAPFYTVKIDERGAGFSSYVLNDYREEALENAPNKELIDDEASSGNLSFTFERKSIPGLEHAVFTSSEPSDTIEVSNEPREILFSWRSADNVVVEKRYRFIPDSYLIGLSVVIKNGSDRNISDRAIIELSSRVESKKGGYAFEGPSGLIDGKLQQIKLKKIKEENRYPGTLAWVAVEDRYFMKSIIPSQPQEAEMRLALNSEENVKNQLVMPEIALTPATQGSYEYQVFFGPKSMKLLNQMGYDLKKAIHFGMFDFIAKPCLWFMNFIYSVIPNYGIAIIILTLLTKILLWPLGSKSYKSMNEMKRLQPLMAEIREKYKNDKKQMNQELMGLYRTYKINPMGGCLPMVLQIPVFFALYRMLYQAIELRHAPFFLWINDLSAPDRLFHFSFSIPLMQPPYGIPVLTLIMGASMLLQQKMSPPPGDPTQAKMMMFMPIIFTVIFVNFSSGLVLYWLVNNVLSIAQQYYIQKKNA